jgi:hypothetical protein
VALYKWFLPGRVDPIPERDVVWPEPAGGWVKMSGLRERLSGQQTWASTVGGLSERIWQELWEVEVDAPKPNSKGMVFAKRGRLVRRIDDWNEECASRLCSEWREQAMGWVREIKSLIPAGMSRSSRTPPFMFSSIMAAPLASGHGAAPYQSAQLNAIIEANVADALNLAAIQAVPPERTDDDVFLDVQMVQNSTMLGAGALACARELIRMGRVPQGFDWYPTMNAGVEMSFVVRLRGSRSLSVSDEVAASTSAGFY